MDESSGMKGEIIPDQDHVMRLCGGSHLREDGSVAPTAFRPRVGEAFLSVNWVEHLNLSTRFEQIVELCRVLSSKRSIGKKAKLALLNVGQIHASHFSAFLSLEVRHQPETTPPDVSHSGIYGVKLDDLLLQDHLARIVLEAIPVKLPLP
jgi:hypothetical protein